MAGWEEQAEGKARPQSPAPLCSWVVAFTGHRGAAHTSQWLPRSHWGHSHRGASSACCLGLDEQPINMGQGRADRAQIQEAAFGAPARAQASGAGRHQVAKVTPGRVLRSPEHEGLTLKTRRQVSGALELEFHERNRRKG